MRNVPSQRAIAEHWFKNGFFADHAGSFYHLKPQCMACDEPSSRWSQLHRCHIIAASIGGSDEHNNLVLLCSVCHNVSPMTNDPKIFWDWLNESHLDGVEEGATVINEIIAY
jgi:5-methylcytosine-specific restriction endonuclease McrA